MILESCANAHGRELYVMQPPPAACDTDCVADMKKIIIGAVVCLIACVGLIPSCQPKDPEVIEEAHRTRGKTEIILTLRHRARTTTVPSDADHVEIEWSGGELQIPLEDSGALANVVHLAQQKHGDQTITVIRAAPEELYWPISQLMRASAAVGVRKLRLQANELQASINLPVAQSGRHRKPYKTIAVLDETEAGQFAIGNRKIKDAKSLTEALNAIKEESQNDLPMVVVTPEPKAAWINIVQACKAIVDAEIKNMGLSRDPQEHRDMPDYAPPDSPQRIHRLRGQ